MTRLDDTEDGRHPDTGLPPDKKLRLVMLGGALPQRHARSAGAEYVTALAEELADLFEVTAFAPAHAANLEALDEGRCIVPSWVVGRRRPSIGWRILTRTDRLIRQLDLALPPLDMVWSLLVPGPTRSAVRAADVVDLQWTEFVSLTPLIRRINPRAVTVGTLHDALTQVAQRKARSTLLKNLQFKLRRRITAWHEGFSSGKVTHLRVLNHKDAAIIATLPGAGDPQVIHPPRPQPRQHDQPRRKHEVIFVGAFGRAVNQDAAEWMLSEVWPRVRQSLPQARLILAGSDPAGAAAQAAEGRTDVTATGFVEDLTDYYLSASAAAVPLRDGGGVKFKTIDALLHRIPVVTTSIGAEGIDGTDLFWAQTDDANEFARALVTALTSPEATTRAVAAGQQVAERYSHATFARSVRRTYGGLAS